MNVLLICSNGISSSLVIARMNQYATAHKLAINVNADNEVNLPYVYHDYDVILFAPQLSHHFQNISDQYFGTGIAFAIIPAKEYGMADGKGLIEFAQDVYQAHREKGVYTFENEALQMISNAGKAKQLSFECLDLVEKKQFAKAEKKISEARSVLITAHQIQSTAIASIMGRDDRLMTPINILMVHAQDQVSTAETTLELTERILRIMKKNG